MYSALYIQDTAQALSANIDDIFLLGYFSDNDEIFYLIQVTKYSNNLFATLKSQTSAEVEDSNSSSAVDLLSRALPKSRRQQMRLA